jgi:sortase A
MKKAFLGLIITIGLITGFWVMVGGALTTGAEGEVLSSSTELEQTITETLASDVPAPSPTAVTPIRVMIPSINVDSRVEFVGLDAEGRMDVPKADENVAWYQLGVKPGDVGSAVVAGHYDRRTGGPAVFYDLEKMVPGDVIKVQGEDGKELEFVVTETAMYKDETFPIDKVFAQTDGKRLNLITCAGQFSQDQKNYSDRFVVFSELVE